MDELFNNNWLAVAGYPKLKEKDFQWIHDFRNKNDAYHSLVDAHFSFVFPDFETTRDDFIKEVLKQAKGFGKFDFQIKSALRNNDRTNEYWHVLLVPDKGFSEIVKLHSRFYSGLFRPLERLDLDFIPHMAIGNSTVPERCKKMVEEINAMNININGTIDKLDIIQFNDSRISTIEVVLLN